MWNSVTTHRFPVGSHRNFSTAATNLDKMVSSPTLPTTDTVLHQIPNCIASIINTKSFVKPTIIQGCLANENPSLIFEKCSKFINNTNGYPNNTRKEHFIEPVHADESLTRLPEVTSLPLVKNTEVMTQKENKKSPKKRGRKRANHPPKKWWKENQSLGVMEVDEVGVEAIEEPMQSSQSLHHPITLNDFLEGTFVNESMPIQCNRVPEQIFQALSSSPICIKISTTPMIISLSPSHMELTRPRRISMDCASEDSFIIFEESEQSESEEESYTESEDEVEDSDDEDDYIVFGACDSNQVSLDLEEDSPKRTPKKVRFAEDRELVTVHRMVAWSFAYQSCRKGHWEEFVRDRERFKRRIEKCQQEIGKVLDAEHRRRVYLERFADSQ